jgi:hypothetical protein
LAATRRAKASELPASRSKPEVVIASALPAAAANASVVSRSMLTQGSRNVLVRVEVTACTLQR